MNREEKALTYFTEEGYNCAESILLSFIKEEDQKMVRLATPFGGGVGRSKDLCGLFTGGVMVIGYFSGREVGGDDSSKSKAYERAREYYLFFEERFQLKCQDILSKDVKEPKQICNQILKESLGFLEEQLGL